MWIRAQTLGSLLRDLALARVTVARLRALAWTEEIQFHIETLEALVDSHEAELERRHELAGEVLDRFDAKVVSRP